MRKPAAESSDLVLLSVSMLAQPAKKATPLAAKMRIRLELVIFVFMVCCVLTAYDLQVERASTAGVNNLFRLSRKCNNRARIALVIKFRHNYRLSRASPFGQIRTPELCN